MLQKGIETALLGLKLANWIFPLAAVEAEYIQH